MSNTNKRYFYFLLILIVGLFPVVFHDQIFLIMLMYISAIYTIAVSGLDILFGYSGQISLGHAAFYGIGAYTSAILSTRLGITPWITMLFGGVLAVIFAVLIAIPAVKLVHHFLVLVTIGFGQIFYTFVGNAKQLTNGHTGIMNIPYFKIGSFSFNTMISYFYVAFFIMLMFLFIKYKIIKSRIGRAFIAIRENPTSANSSGINVRYYKIMAFAISAFYTGIAGAMYAHFTSYISPSTFTFSQSIIFFVMLLVGGKGSLFGPLFGAVAVTVIVQYLQGMSQYQGLVYGMILLFTVLFFPRGIFGIDFIKLKKYFISKKVV